MPAQMDASHWIGLMAAMIAIFAVLVTILLWQMSSIKATMEKQGETLFAKIEALADKKISFERCKEYRDICYQNCPYRHILSDCRERNGE